MTIATIDRSSDNADRLRVSVLVLAGFAVWTFLWLGPVALLVSAAIGAVAYAVTARAAARRIASNQQEILRLLRA